MRKDKEIAVEMRKAGKSYREIRSKLKIPLSTLSEWFSGEDWSQKIRKKLTDAAQIENTTRIIALDKVRGQNLEKIYKEARQEAIRELETFKYNPLFIAGLMLYWGEGDKKTRNQVRLSNADPELIKLYVTFLSHACRIPLSKIKAQVLVYPDIDEPSNKRFWAFASGVPISQFTKSISILGRHKVNRLTNGVCIIVVSSAYLKVKMTEWLRLLPKELMNKGYYENI